MIIPVNRCKLLSCLVKPVPVTEIEEDVTGSHRDMVFLLKTSNIFQHEKRNLESLSGHVLNEKSYGAHLQKRQNSHFHLPNN